MTIILSTHVTPVQHATIPKEERLIAPKDIREMYVENVMLGSFRKTLHATNSPTHPTHPHLHPLTTPKPSLLPTTMDLDLEEKNETYVTYVEPLRADMTRKVMLDGVTRNIGRDAVIQFTALPTGGARLTSRSPFGDNSSIWTYQDQIMFIRGEPPRDDFLGTSELILFHPGLIDLKDILNAGLIGAYRVRKWPPNRTTKKPNKGYSVYFYNEQFAGLALAQETVYLKDRLCRLLPKAPREINNSARYEYRQERKQDLICLASELRTGEIAAVTRLAKYILSTNVQDRSEDPAVLTNFMQEVERRLERQAVEIEEKTDAKLHDLHLRIEKNSNEIEAVKETLDTVKHTVERTAQEAREERFELKSLMLKLMKHETHKTGGFDQYVDSPDEKKHDATEESQRKFSTPSAQQPVPHGCSEWLQQLSSDSEHHFVINGTKPLRSEQDKQYYTELSMSVSTIKRYDPLKGGNPLIQTTLDEAWNTDKKESMEEKEAQICEDAVNEHQGLCIIQWNSYHLDESKTAQLHELSFEENADVLFVSEFTSVLSHPDRRPPRIPGFHPPWLVRPIGSKGIVAYVSKKRDYRILSSSSTDDDPSIIFQSLEICGPSGGIRCDHVYVNPSVHRQERMFFWDKLTSNVTGPYLVVGDLNERSSRFYDDATEYSSSLDRIIEKHNMIILNDGSPTRLQMRNGAICHSAPDIGLVNELAATLQPMWYTKLLLDSDHLPCVTRLQFNAHELVSQQKRKKVNYRLYIKKFKYLFTNSDEPIQTRFLSVLETLKAYDFHNQQMVLPCPWWSAKLKELKLQRNRARKRQQPNKYLELRKCFRKEFYIAKSQYYESQINLINSGKNPWPIVKRHFSKVLPKSKSSISGPRSKMKEIGTSLLQQYWTLMQTDMEEKHEPVCGDAEPILFNYWEVSSALKASNQRSTAGFDGITYHHLLRICEDANILGWLTQTCSRWATEGLPEAMKTARIIPIPKGRPGEGYRPISLLSCVAKLTDRMITKRMDKKYGNLIPPNQNGCRAGASATDSVMSLIDASCKARHDDKSFAALFVDYSKAYDRVEHRILLEKMKRMGINNSYIRFTELWLQNRRIRVTTGQYDSPAKTITRGLPQGCAFSVLLWKIYVSDFPGTSYESTLFMDDTAIWVQASNARQLEIKLQTKVDRLREWCTQNNLLLNVNKTNIMTNDSLDEIEVFYGEEKIEQVTRTKYLGFWLYNRPGISQQIYFDLQPLASDLNRRTRLLGFLPRQTKASVTSRISNALVIGKLRYYLPLLSIEDKSTVKCLETALREFRRRVTGAIPSTPEKLLEVQTGIPQLRSLIDRSLQSTTLRMWSNPNGELMSTYERWMSGDQYPSPILGIHQQIERLPEDIVKIGLAPKTHLPVEVMDELRNVVFHVDNTKTNFSAKMMPHYDFEIWTDGSLLTNEEERSAAAGWVLANQQTGSITQRCAAVWPTTSSFHSELAAMQIALKEHLDDIDSAETCFTLGIYSDSLSLLKHMRRVTNKDSRTDQDTVLTLTILSDLATTYDEIHLHWIPGHRGVGLNPLADQLAELGHTSQEEIKLDLPPSMIKKQWNIYNSEVISNRRDTITEGSFGTLLMSRESFRSGMGCFPTGVCSADANAIFRVRSGHTCLATMLFKLGVLESDLCRLCGCSQETLPHLFTCPKLPQQARTKLTRRPLCSGWDSVKTLIEECDEEAVIALMGFMRILRHVGLTV